MIKKDELNLATIKLYWITEAEEALTVADHLDEKHQRDIQVAENNDDLNKTIQIFLREVGKKYNIIGAYIYGSFAKGTSHKWSVIDLAIISPDFSDDLFEDRLYLMRLAISIDDRIEPRPFRKESFKRNDPLVDEILKNGLQHL